MFLAVRRSAVAVHVFSHKNNFHGDVLYRPAAERNEFSGLQRFNHRIRGKRTFPLGRRQGVKHHRIFDFPRKLLGLLRPFIPRLLGRRKVPPVLSFFLLQQHFQGLRPEAVGHGPPEILRFRQLIAVQIRRSGQAAHLKPIAQGIVHVVFQLLCHLRIVSVESHDAVIPEEVPVVFRQNPPGPHVSVTPADAVQRHLSDYYNRRKNRHAKGYRNHRHQNGGGAFSILHEALPLLAPTNPR